MPSPGNLTTPCTSNAQEAEWASSRRCTATACLHLARTEIDDRGLHSSIAALHGNPPSRPGPACRARRSQPPSSCFLVCSARVWQLSWAPSFSPLCVLSGRGPRARGIHALVVSLILLSSICYCFTCTEELVVPPARYYRVPLSTISLPAYPFEAALGADLTTSSFDSVSCTITLILSAHRSCPIRTRAVAFDSRSTSTRPVDRADLICSASSTASGQCGRCLASNESHAYNILRGRSYSYSRYIALFAA